MNEYLIKAFISKGGTVEELLEAISNSDTTFDDKVWQANQVKNMFEVLNAETPKGVDTNSTEQPKINGEENKNDKVIPNDNNSDGISNSSVPTIDVNKNNDKNEINELNQRINNLETDIKNSFNALKKMITDNKTPVIPEISEAEKDLKS